MYAIRSYYDTQNFASGSSSAKEMFSDIKSTTNNLKSLLISEIENFNKFGHYLPTEFLKDDQIFSVITSYSIHYTKLYDRQKEYLSLLVVNIDEFKAFNDIYGENEGDECIKIRNNFV